VTRRVRSWIDYQSEDSEGVTKGETVHEPEGASEPRWTGLLDARGEPIMREPERIGFRLKP
jgi:hypothetical protein